MSDIQTLVDNIPTAEDGNLITANFHNSIKKALEAIAAQLGTSGSGTQTKTFNVPMNFLPIAGSPSWSLKIGFANDSGTQSTDGWIPLSLPQGALLQQIAATGIKLSATAATGSIKLLAIGLNGSDIHPLGSISLKDVPVGNNFSASVPAQVASTDNPNLLTVDNTQFKYAIEGQVSLAAPPATPTTLFTIFSIQVVYATS